MSLVELFVFYVMEPVKWRNFLKWAKQPVSSLLTGGGLIGVIVFFTNFTQAYIDCPLSPPSLPGPGFIAGVPIFDIEIPNMFITAYSQKYDPYSLVDRYKRTSILREYLMIGYQVTSTGTLMEGIQMVIYNGVENVDEYGIRHLDLVKQNLEKELYWEYFNSTGVYPSLTAFNTTTSFTLPFQARLFYNRAANQTDQIALHTMVFEREYPLEPHIPMDCIIEVPIGSRVMRRAKTIVEWNSFGLWRWKLSNKTISWDQIDATFSSTKPGIPKPPLPPGQPPPTYESYLSRIDNPCIKDLFLVFVHREDLAIPGKKYFYLASPLVQSQLGEHWFYDMTTDEHPWANETFEKMVLTNDRLVVLTDSTLWISASLNHTKRFIEPDREDRPVLMYNDTDPCEKYIGSIQCFYDATLVDPNCTRTSVPGCDSPIVYNKLFYNPVCYLFQFPNYDDYLIFVVTGDCPNNGFSVFYSTPPYKFWRVLFANAYYYMKTIGEEQWKIMDVVGVFFNHHLRQFDITVKLYGPLKGRTQTCMHTRFALPEPTTSYDGYGEALPSSKKKQLRDTMGNGFLDFDFPANFIVNSVVVNGDTMDVFFLGNQLWIAEAGGPFIYASLTGLSEVKESLCSGSTGGPRKAIIHECSFNHPDRSYLCLNEDRRLMLAGRIGSAYSPLVTETERIEEFIEAQLENTWPREYFCTVMQKKSIFFAGFSGAILLWYLHEPDTLTAGQADLLSSSQPCHMNEPIICGVLERWKTLGCTAIPDGQPMFRMLAMDPVGFTPRMSNTDGPLVPFFIDANAAILFEGIVPPHQDNYYVYFSEVNIGQKIYCRNHDLLVENERSAYHRHNCELFMRHIKRVEEYLDGFRRCLYVTIIKSIPLLPIPADIVILILARSNQVLVKVDDNMNDPPWTFLSNHTGQTLYLPGNFSILLAGFPKRDASGAVDRTVMKGFITRFYNLEQRLVYNAFHSYLIDMSTQTFRAVHEDIAAQTLQDDLDRLKEIDDKHQKERDDLIATRKRIQERWELSPFSHDTSGVKLKIFEYDLPPQVKKRDEIEREFLTVRDEERLKEFCSCKTSCPAPCPVPPTSCALCPQVKPPASWTPPPLPDDDDLVGGEYVEYANRTVWYVAEGECHYILSLMANSVLKSHGGRIILDLHDSISFGVHLASNSLNGKIMMYRPLLVVTNSNPEVLKIEKTEHLQNDPQSMMLVLAPTGKRPGVAVITIRSVVSSLKCQQSTSVTYIILVHRTRGRRLFANYPIALCKPQRDSGRYPRPWLVDRPGCIREEEVLDEENLHIQRFHVGRSHIAYQALPPNYRPPSFRGTDIPLTPNVYHGDPSKPAYKAWYRVSRDSIRLNQCSGKPSREDCDCSDFAKLSDDELYSECKQKVFHAHRSKPIRMSLEYDRLMLDRDQFKEFFTPKLNWSVYIEEINGRTEWHIENQPEAYLDMINGDEKINNGKTHYNMKNFNVTLLGTGLFHFKATLGKFESFGDVTGYFMLYANPGELNHIHMFMILLMTIVFCFTMVFLGFIAVRKRLSSALPLQPMSHKKKLKLM